MIKVIYIDEEVGWQSIAYSALSENYDLYIPEELPQNISDLWDDIKECQIAILDYRLNGNGVLAYTGDDVVRMIHEHNKHFPAIIITSFEDNAIQECTEIQLIRDKGMLNEGRERLFHMIDSAVTIYDRKKSENEACIRKYQDKIASGEKLSSKEEADRFDAELYISELDLDSSMRGNLITANTISSLEELLSMARIIVEKHRK